MLRKKHTVKGKNMIGGKELKQLREQTLVLYGLCSSVQESMMHHYSSTLLAGEEPPMVGDASSTTQGSSDALSIAESFFPKKSQCTQFRWAYGGATGGGQTQALVFVVNDVPLLVGIERLADFDSASHVFGGSSLSGDSAVRYLPTIFGFLRLRQVVAGVVQTLPCRTGAEAASLPGGSVALSSSAPLSAPLSPAALHVDNIMPMLTFTDARCGLVVWINEFTAPFLFRGAHLMGSGIQCLSRVVPLTESSSSSPTNLPQLRVGDVAYVCVLNNPTPLAVGLVTPALVQAFHPSRRTITLPSPRYPLSMTVTFLPRDAPVIDGPGVFVVTSIGDHLWEEFIHGYHVFCTGKVKLSKDSSLVVPPTHRDCCSGAPMQSSSVKGIEGFNLFAFEQRGDDRSANDGGDESDEVENEGGADGAEDDTLVEADNNDAFSGADSAVADAKEEQDDVGQQEVNWWTIFPDADALVMFALCETVRATKPSQLPLPTTAFVSQLSRFLPHGLPLEMSSSSSGCTGGGGGGDVVDPTSAALVTSRQIDWKKLSFKKALALLNHVNGDLLELKEVKPGVHAIVKLMKSSMTLRDHKRKYQEFLNLVHYPIMEDEEERAATEDALRIHGGGSGGGESSILKLRANMKIASIEYLYRPQHGMDQGLVRLLVNGTWTSTNTAALGECANATPTTDEDDEDDDDDHDDDGGMKSAMRGLTTTKRMHDSVRAYAAANGLLIISPGQAPNIIVDSLLRQLWPSNKTDVPDTIPLLDLDVLVERRFCAMHIIRYEVGVSASAAGVRVPRPRLRNGKPTTVFVHVEKRSGNKFVTIVSGLDAYGFSLEALALSWKNKFATSVAIVDPVVRDHLILKSGTKVPRILQLQGRHDMETFLCREMGLPKSTISSKK